MKLQYFISKLADIYGDNLESVALYGSAAQDEFIEGSSDYNTIIVLKNLVPIELIKSNKLVAKWIRKGNSIPLFFDREHIETSLDVFPIEFYDISDNHKTLYGEDLFEHLKIDPTNLRHQCESELKGKVLQLQSKFVINSQHHKFIGRLMTGSISSFVAIFKGVLRMTGKPPAIKAREIVEQLSQFIEFSPAIFSEILDNKEGKGFFGKDDAIEKFERYLTELKKVTKFVDKYSA